MAKSSSSSCSAWKSVSPTAVSVGDDGDVLQPLKRVRDKYIAKAAELKEKAYGDNRAKILAAAASYERMADSVGRLIGMLDADDRNEMRLDVLDDRARLDDGDVIAAAVGYHDDTQA